MINDVLGGGQCIETDIILYHWSPDTGLYIGTSRAYTDPVATAMAGEIVPLVPQWSTLEPPGEPPDGHEWYRNVDDGTWLAREIQVAVP